MSHFVGVRPLGQKNVVQDIHLDLVGRIRNGNEVGDWVGSNSRGQKLTENMSVSKKRDCHNC